MTRVLLVDDHDIVRRGLRDLLETELPQTTIGEARTAAEATGLLLRESWDLVLLDLNLPGRSGLEVLAECRRLRPKAAVLVVTSYPEEQFAVRALSMGASGYITKQEAADQMVVAIRQVLGGGRYVSASLAQHLASALSLRPRDRPHEVLSPRELQVLRLVAMGRTLKEAAAEMGLSEKTAATYRARIATKTGLTSVAEIVRYATKHGLID